MRNANGPAYGGVQLREKSFSSTTWPMIRRRASRSTTRNIVNSGHTIEFPSCYALASSCHRGFSGQAAGRVIYKSRSDWCRYPEVASCNGLLTVRRRQRTWLSPAPTLVHTCLPLEAMPVNTYPNVRIRRYVDRRPGKS